jgi:mRNA interferase MazF
MIRGEVWWVEFGPSLGGEIQKTRPAVIRLYPCEAMVMVRGERRKAMADQIATVSKQRLKSRLDRLTAEDMEAVETAVRLQLGLSG